MGIIILSNIFANYFIAMPIIIVAIIKKWAFLAYFKTLIFSLLYFNLFFWIIYLIYYTFVKKPKLLEIEKLRLYEEEKKKEKEKTQKEGFEVENNPDEEELLDIINESNLDQKEEKKLNENIDDSLKEDIISGNTQFEQLNDDTIQDDVAI